MTLAFAKYHGAGNDFIVVDGRLQSAGWITPARVQALCRRHTGIGADGLLLLRPSTAADFTVTIYNCDGTLPRMCGNGIRCVGQFLCDQGLLQTERSLEVGDERLIVRRCGGGIDVTMGPLRQAQWDRRIEGEAVDFLDTGVPHAVVFVDDIGQADLIGTSRRLRHHPDFGPEGTNVTLAQVKGGAIHVRTYERGVEGETLACGTGAAAAALAAARQRGLAAPIDVHTRSGDCLRIRFEQADDRFHSIGLWGHATKVFTGQVDPMGFHC